MSEPVAYWVEAMREAGDAIWYCVRNAKDVKPEELIDARWFTREETASMIEAGGDGGGEMPPSEMDAEAPAASATKSASPGGQGRTEITGGGRRGMGGIGDRKSVV